MNFLLPFWNLTFQKDHMKNSTKTDLSFLNIYSLTNLLSFHVKSIHQNLSWALAGNYPLGVHGAGAPQDHTPPSRGTREVSSPQAPPLLLSIGLLADQGQQQDDLSFPQAQRVVLQHRGGNGGMVDSDLPPAIWGCSWVTLGLRSYSALHQIFTPLEKDWGKNLYELKHSATMTIKEIVFWRMD